MTSESSPLPKLTYNMREACQITGIGRTTLYAHLLKGNIRAIRIGGRTLFKPTDLQAFIDAGKTWEKTDKGEDGAVQYDADPA